MCAEADLELAMRFRSVHAQIDLNLPRGFESARGQAHVARSGLSVPLRLPTCGIISLELAMRLGASKVATSWHKKEDSERKEGKEAREGKMEGKGRKEGVAVLKR